MAPGVVTASMHDEERTLTSTLSRYVSSSEGASGSEEASDFELSHSTWSNEATSFGSRS